jgi:hypothetical protein
MQFELKGALKKYRRMRSWRRIVLVVVVLGVIGWPWAYDFSRTDTLICWVGAFVFWIFGELELRLKTMQIRLAEMADRLDALSGGEPEDNLILELNDW